MVIHFLLRLRDLVVGFVVGFVLRILIDIGVAIVVIRVNSLRNILAVSWSLCRITFSIFVELPPEKLNDPVRHACGALCLSSSMMALVCMIDF